MSSEPVPSLRRQDYTCCQQVDDVSQPHHLPSSTRIFQHRKQSRLRGMQIGSMTRGWLTDRS